MTHRPRWVASGWLAALLSAALPVAAADSPAENGAKNCQFRPPAAWSDRNIRWDGACLGGHAQGRGVLRAYPPAGQPAAAVWLFFGALDKGELRLGVIDTPDGYIAGRFEDGKPVQDGDRNRLISAFREGSAAAQAASERFKSTGNSGSARFYADKARQLAEQLD